MVRALLLKYKYRSIWEENRKPWISMIWLHWWMLITMTGS